MHKHPQTGRRSPWPIFSPGLWLPLGLAAAGQHWAGRAGWVAGLVCGGLLSCPLLLMAGVMWVFIQLFVWLSGGPSV